MSRKARAATDDMMRWTCIRRESPPRTEAFRRIDIAVLSYLRGAKWQLAIALVASWLVLGATPALAQSGEGQPQVTSNDTPVWTSSTAWRLSPSATLQIGVGTGEKAYQLYRVANAVRLQSGQIVVANAGTGQLRIYDAGGHFVRSIGTLGDGPGEFRSLAWVARVAVDSLIVWDQRLARLSYFRLDGSFVGSTTVDAPEGQLPELFGAWQDSLLIGGVRTNLIRPSEGIVPDTMRYLVYDHAGHIVRSVGEFPDREFYTRVSQSGSRVNITSVAVPFARLGRMAIAPGGFYFGTGESYEISFYSRTGELHRTIRRPVKNHPVTEDVKRQWVEGTAAYSATVNVRRLQQRMLQSVPFPETLPAYRSLLVDDLSNLWVREYTLTDDTAVEWQVFDPEGKWLGGVDFPPRLDPTQIGPDFVLGMWQDANEIEYIRMYQLLKP